MSDDYGFKFNIGDVCKIAGTVAPDGERLSQRWRVVSRTFEQCSGGIQRGYICRMINAHGGISDRLFTLSEVELEASEPFKETEGGFYRRMTDEIQKQNKSKPGDAPTGTTDRVEARRI